MNHFEMASAFSDAGHKDSFFVYAYKAAKVFEKYKDEEMLAKVYGNIGLVCVYLQKMLMQKNISSSRLQ